MKHRLHLLPALLAVVALLTAPLATAHAASSARTAARVPRTCGSFRVHGLQTHVRVRITRGGVPCHRANHVMAKLFRGGANREAPGWRCVGPQTGYAACTKGHSQVTASF